MKSGSYVDEVLELLITAGEIMLKSGAETYRVEETIERIGRAFTKGEVEIFATPTGLIISLEDDLAVVRSRVKRIKVRKIDLNKIAQINNLSRRIAIDGIGLAEAKEYVNQVNWQGDIYHSIIRTLAFGTAASCFSYVFGGKLGEMLIALFGGIIVSLIANFLNKRVNLIFTVFISGIFITFIALLAEYVYKTNLNAIIMGTIMLFVPGVAITNAIRDTLSEDYLSAAARGLEALLVSLSVAAGVALVLGLWFKYVI